jgi:hypothetical protein
MILSEVLNCTVPPLRVESLIKKPYSCIVLAFLATVLSRRLRAPLVVAAASVVTAKEQLGLPRAPPP